MVGVQCRGTGAGVLFSEVEKGVGSGFGQEGKTIDLAVF